MSLLAPHNGPKHAKFFTVVFYGVRNSYYKNAQFCAMQRESEMTELPGVANRMQHRENACKRSSFNYKLDRLGRSLQHLAQLIGEFETHGTALVATSQGIDTSESNPAGRLQMHVLAAVAEFERSVIRERINAGLAAARERRTRLGRPRTLDRHLGAVAKLSRRRFVRT